MNIKSIAKICLTSLLILSATLVKGQCVSTVPPLAGGNNFAAVTFNVKAYQALTITEIWNSFLTGSWLVNVYYKTDSINQTTSNWVVSTSTGWTLLASNVSINVTSGAAGSIQQIPYTFSLSMPAGAVYGFCVEGVTSSSTSPTSIYYTNTTTSQVYLDANLHINTSINVGWAGVTAGLVNNGRMFNGKICYTTAPPCTAPSGLSSSSVTNTSATLSWGAVSGSLGYEYILDNTSANPSGSGTATTSTSYNAGGLNPNTTYYMHVRNKCGTTTFSSWVTTSFTTLNSPVTCTAPATASVSNLTSSSANFNWSTVSGSGGYEYKVDQVATGPASGYSSTFSPSASVTGLSSGTGYYLHVRNICSPTNKSNWLNFAFTTYTCNRPVSVIFSNITDSAVDVLWSQMPNVSSFDYAVDFSNQNPVSYMHTTGITAHLTSLLPNSKYYLHVRSRCFTSDSSDWRLDSFATLFVCYVPNVQVNYLGTDNPFAYWSPIPTAIAYEFALTNTSNKPAFGTTINATNVSLNLPDDGKDYYLHVRAKCNSMFTFSQWATVALRTGTTAVNNVQGESIALYPNPVQNTLYLKGTIGNDKYIVTDITGHLLFRGITSPALTEVSTTSLAPGIYILKMQSNSKETIFRFMKN